MQNNTQYNAHTGVPLHLSWTLKSPWWHLPDQIVSSHHVSFGLVLIEKWNWGYDGIMIIYILSKTYIDTTGWSRYLNVSSPVWHILCFMFSVLRVLIGTKHVFFKSNYLFLCVFAFIVVYQCECK